MEAIKNLTKEFNKKFTKNSAKVFIALFLFILLVIGTFIGFSALTMLFTSFVPSFIFAIVSFFTMLCAYAMVFIFFYGVIILVTRLERGMSSSLGYLFLGFKHKRIKSAVCVFTFFALICMLFSSIPLMKTIDVSAQNPFAKIFQNPKLFMKLSFMTLCIFIFVSLFLFLRFSFTWNILYDNSGISGFGALRKSFKMFKRNIFKFLGFEIYLTKYLILVLVSIRVLNYLPMIFPQLTELKSFAAIFEMVRFLCGMIFFAKVTFSIPFCYDIFIKNESLKN